MLKNIFLLKITRISPEFKMRHANHFREEIHFRSKKFCRIETSRKSAGFTKEND